MWMQQTLTLYSIRVRVRSSEAERAMLRHDREDTALIGHCGSLFAEDANRGKRRTVIALKGVKAVDELDLVLLSLL